MINSSNLNSGKSENSQRLSDLLDNKCDSSDLDKLLEHADTSETWYRFQTVSSLLRNEHSARVTPSFCREISSKLASEPAIIASPAKNRPLQSRKTAEISPIRRFSGGLAIAASAAFATFFSVQTLQFSDNSQPNYSKQHAVVDGVNNHSTASRSSNNVSAKISDSLEQTQLEFSSDLYKLGVLRSGDISQQQVSGAYVETIRLSAEQWQDLLTRAAKRKAAKEASQSHSSSDLNLPDLGAGSKENN